MAEHLVDESGGEVFVRPGDRIQITVTENASTGYVWAPSAVPEGVVVAGSRSELGDDFAPGQAGSKVFVFDVTGPVLAGELRLDLKREWEPEPAKTVTVEVTPADASAESADASE